MRATAIEGNTITPTATTIPPTLSHTIHHPMLTGKVESDVLKASNLLNEKLRALTSSEKYRDLPFILFGPFEAPVYRVDSRYRMRMVVKCKLGAQTRRLFAQLLTEFPAEGATAPTLSIDFNPTNL